MQTGFRLSKTHLYSLSKIYIYNPTCLAFLSISLYWTVGYFFHLFLGMEDWDLQAVVRGFSSGTSLDSPLFCFDPFHNDQQDDLISSFPCDEELFETRREILDELDQLYKPFYPLFQPLTNTSISAATEAKEEEQLQKEEATPMADTTAATVRLRRRLVVS